MHWYVHYLCIEYSNKWNNLAMVECSWLVLLEPTWSFGREWIKNLAWDLTPILWTGLWWHYFLWVRKLPDHTGCRGWGPLPDVGCVSRMAHHQWASWLRLQGTSGIPSIWKLRLWLQLLLTLSSKFWVSSSGGQRREPFWLLYAGVCPLTPRHLVDALPTAQTARMRFQVFMD